MKNNLEQQILEFNLLYKRYDNIYRRAARKFDMCELEFMILYVLRSFNPEKSRCAQKDLSQILMHPKQSINSALKSLLQKGLVRLTPSSDNQRVKYIYLTEKGMQLAERTADILIGAERKAFCSMTEEERETLLSLFGKLTGLIDEQFCQIRGSR